MAFLLQIPAVKKTSIHTWRNQTVGKSVKNPKKHIVSCRVNEGEMETLQHLTEESGISISDLLRQSLLQLCDQPHHGTQQAA
jgi:hypothetical protein